jgi:hypothetical protein
MREQLTSGHGQQFCDAGIGSPGRRLTGLDRNLYSEFGTKPCTLKKTRSCRLWSGRLEQASRRAARLRPPGRSECTILAQPEGRRGTQDPRRYGPGEMLPGYVGRVRRIREEPAPRSPVRRHREGQGRQASIYAVRIRDMKAEGLGAAAIAKGAGIGRGERLSGARI